MEKLCTTADKILAPDGRSKALAQAGGSLLIFERIFLMETQTLVMDFLNSPIFWIVVAAASEIVALSPARSNSIVQLVFQALNSVKPKKK